MQVSLLHLQRFVAVAKQRSFTRAAALAGVDQPALSRQIKQLERQIGIQLFERHGKRITLTTEGSELYEASRGLDLAVMQINEKIADLMRRRRTWLVICVAKYSSSVEARHNLLNNFAAIRPDVPLEITAVEWTEEIVETVKSGKADFGMIFSPVSDPAIEGCEMHKVSLACAIPCEHPLAGKTSVAFKNLAGEPLVLPARHMQSITETVQYKPLLEAGVLPIYVPEGYGFQFDLAKRKRLCVVCAADSKTVPDDFVKLPFDDPLPNFTLNLIRAKRAMSPFADRFWRLAHESWALSGKVPAVS